MQAPGLSIKTLFTTLSENDLKLFIDQRTLDIISVLNPQLLSHENLVDIALNSSEPIEMIRNDHTRNLIINLLSISKARELAAKLGIHVKDTILYDEIVSKATDRKSEPALRSFFGIVVPEVAPIFNQPSQIEVAPRYSLFPHQQDVASRVLSALETHPYKTVMHMPTGAGKTRTAMHIISNILNRHPDKLVVWLAQSGELLEQAADEFAKAWASIGSFPTNVYRFWGQYDPDISQVKSGFLVAGLGKLNALSKQDGNMIMCLGDRAVLIVIDEAHQAIAPTYKKLINYLYEKKPSNALLGLTATPGRTWADIDEDAVLADFFGNNKVMLKISGYPNPVTYLINHGYLAQPTFRTLNVEPGVNLSTDDLRQLTDAEDIPPDVLQKLADDEQRSIRIISTVEDLCKRHRRVILFASSVRHAHSLASILSLREMTASVVTGYTDGASRDRILTRYKGSDPKPMVICNYGVLTTGFDAPQTSAILIARPTRSLVLYSQMVGRAIRGIRAGGNAEAEIVTVIDPRLPGFGNIAEAFINWEDVWNEQE